MNRILSHTLILGGAMLLLGNSLRGDSRRPDAKLTVTIHVYNYARISNRTLVRTEKHVTSIFLRAGIQLEWMDCILASGNGPDPAAWSGEPSPSDLILNIVPKFRAKDEGFRDGLYGFATGYQATVVNERTDEVAYSGETTSPQVLGITIAHELGHLLLGPNSHTENGIMSPRWAGKDFRNVQTKTLTFTQGQAEQMRQRILRRKDLASE